MAYYRKMGMFQGPGINNDDLFVAVKTCEKYHTDRGKYFIWGGGQRHKPTPH